MTYKFSNGTLFDGERKEIPKNINWDREFSRKGFPDLQFCQFSKILNEEMEEEEEEKRKKIFQNADLPYCRTVVVTL